MNRLSNKVRLLGVGLCCACLLASCSPQQRLTRLVDRHPCLVSDTLLHIGFNVPLPPIGARVRVPAVPDTTFEVTDSSSGITFNVRLSDSTIDVQAIRAPDTLNIDTTVTAPRLNIEDRAAERQERRQRRRQIIFAVCFCCTCVTIWFGSTVILKFIK